MISNAAYYRISLAASLHYLVCVRLNNGKRIKYSKYSVYLGECSEINNSCYSEIWESDFLEWILKYFSNSEWGGEVLSA